MNFDSKAQRRLGPDPRQRPTGFWDSVLARGERIWNRRADDRREPYFVDRFPTSTMVLILALLVLSVVDGVLTIELVDVDCQELNPLMRHLLGKGPLWFLFGKYILTAAGLPVLLVFKNFRLFGSRFSVGYLIPIFVLMYASLVSYQIQLLRRLKPTPYPACRSMQKPSSSPQARLSPPVSRRQMLRTAVAAGGLALAGPRPSTADDADLADAKTGPIDAHVHVWTPDGQRYPLAAGFRREEMKPPSFTPEQLFGHARPCGVARVVLIQMSFYGFDNSYMLDTIHRFPGVFAGVAVIDDTVADPAAEMRTLAQRGVSGFRIYPRNQNADQWLDSPGMQAMWRCGAEENLAMCHLVNPDALAAVDRACRRFPDTPVVIDHFARIGVDGQFRAADVDALCKLAKHRRTYVKISAFYALGKKQAPYLDLAPLARKLLDAFGPDRLMWATDCPYQVQEGHTYEDSIALVRDRFDFLSAGDKEWLLRKTAEKVFFDGRHSPRS